MRRAVGSRYTEKNDGTRASALMVHRPRERRRRVKIQDPVESAAMSRQDYLDYLAGAKTSEAAQRVEEIRAVRIQSQLRTYLAKKKLWRHALEREKSIQRQIAPPDVGGPRVCDAEVRHWSQKA